MDESSTKQPIDLRDVLRPITARWWLIAIVVALATVLTYRHYSSQPKAFSASTRLYIGSTDPTQLVSMTASDRETADLAQLVNSSAVADLVAKEVHFRGNPQSLMGGVSARPSSGSDFVTISAAAGTGSGAAELANAVAQAFVVNETKTIHHEAAQGIAHAARELAALPKTTGTATQRGTLGETISQMQSLEALPTAGIQHIDPASPPGAPFAPNPKQSAIFAFVISLMLMVAGSFGLERLDRRIRKLADLEPIYGHPVLATVPRVAKPAPIQDGVAILPEDLREHFRKLRISVQLAAIDEPPRTIAITSAIPREGKSTVTRNLALAYREAGFTVCVVDADLRRPAIGGLLNVAGKPGLTDVLIGETSLREALKHAAAGVPGLQTLTHLHGDSGEVLDPTILDDNISDHPATGAAYGADVGSVVVLPSGPEPANPPVALGSDQMRTVLKSLATDFDVVLVDTSPLLAVTDAVPLLTAADGVVVVARLGLTTSDAAENLVEQIRRIPGANLLGIVANDAHGKDAGMKSYSYGYGYSRSKSVV
jgi:Mrp family chromosome partitioning ATPase/capsular polysaccharide biosynthesis protein